MDMEQMDSRISSPGLKKIIMVDEEGRREELTEKAIVFKADEDQDPKMAFVGLDREGDDLLMIADAFVDMIMDFGWSIWMLNALARKIMDRWMEDNGD